jgi:hypothetical protein
MDTLEDQLLELILSRCQKASGTTNTQPTVYIIYNNIMYHVSRINAGTQRRAIDKVWVLEPALGIVEVQKHKLKFFNNIFRLSRQIDAHPSKI